VSNRSSDLVYLRSSAGKAKPAIDVPPEFIENDADDFPLPAALAFIAIAMS
jgi:hypothetical protein